jgi:hypothetical protein
MKMILAVAAVRFIVNLFNKKEAAAPTKNKYKDSAIKTPAEYRLR